MADAQTSLNISLFTGVAAASGPHAVGGVAIGVRPRPGPVTLEFEYARSRSDSADRVPGIMTFAGNLLFQFPAGPSQRVQLYGTFGVGFYGLSLDGRNSEVSDARNVGGGAKIALTGPWKLRMDYRLVRLAPISGELHANQQRFTAGIVAGF